jgi:hypothetical protein
MRGHNSGGLTADVLAFCFSCFRPREKEKERKKKKEREKERKRKRKRDKEEARNWRSLKTLLPPMLLRK